MNDEMMRLTGCKLLLVVAAMSVVTGVLAGKDTPQQRAQKLVAAMTLEEKLTLLHGNQSRAGEFNATGYVGFVPGVKRLGIPGITMNDGPQGFRGPPGTSTQWPSGLTVAQSWDRSVMAQFGQAMGAEFAGKGCDVQFGPGVNINRVPWGGRAFEYLSGEDPFLGHEMAFEAVSGIQSQGVIANMKHFVNNNEETNRHYVSNNVDERTEMEIYMAPYEGAVKAGVMSAMCANSRVNQWYSCESEWAIQTLLRGKVNFTGFMLSDYRGTQSTVNAANHGLDIQMPGCVRPDPKNPKLCASDSQRPNYFGEPLLRAVEQGQVSRQTIDAKVERILTALITSGAMDRSRDPARTADTNVTSDAHNQLARTLAIRSTILLQNKNNFLPLRPDGNQTIAVIGAAALTAPITGGGGSGAVTPGYVSTIFGAVVEATSSGDSGNVTCTRMDNTDLLQSHNEHNAAHSFEDCCQQCSTRPSCMAFTYSTTLNMCWFKPDMSGKRPKQGDISGACQRPPSRVRYDDGSDIQRAAQLAASSDIAIVVLASSSHEDADRPTIQMPEANLTAAVGKAQPNTIAIVAAPGQFVPRPWMDDVAAILAVGMSGQEQGRAVTDVIFNGQETQQLGCPCGRLPYTLPNVENETGFTPDMFPGINNEANYSEKLNIGYRWYTSNNVKPAFPFGFGLAFTSFAFSDLTMAAAFNVTVTVKNTGSRAGRSVAQLYITFPENSGEPPLQLRGFQNNFLQAGDSAVVTFPLSPRAFSIWDVSQHQWQVVKGTFILHAGASSQDLPLTHQVQI